MYNCVVMVEYVRSIITAQFSTTTITTYFSMRIRVYRPTIISEINMILGGFVMQTHLD